jgi:DNA-binding NtrC family response regulator
MCIALAVSPRDTTRSLVSSLSFLICKGSTGGRGRRVRAGIVSRGVSEGGGSGVVLVVDDEPAIRLLVRVNLELEGYRVVEAATLDAARRGLDSGDVGLVLLDMRIGRERGDSLLDELHALSIPVVVVTGSADVQEAEWAGRADAVLGKPFEIDELLRAVRSLARMR